MTEPVKALLIFVNEADLRMDTPLYEVIVKRLRELGVAGATAQAGLIGFGHHHLVHDRGLFGMAADRPVTIMAIDSEATIRRILPDVQKLVTQGLIALMPLELVAAPGGDAP